MNRNTLAAIWPPTGVAAEAAGHERLSPVQAIRSKCLDCTGHQPAEVRYCEAVTCPLWPFRAGRHPYTKKGLQDADSGRDHSGGSPVPQSASSSPIALLDGDFGQGGEVEG